MESWSYATEGKGLLFSDEMDLPVDAFARTRKAIMGWEIKPSCNFENNGLISDREAVENMEFMDLGFPDMTRRPFNSNMSVGLLGGEYVSESSKRLTSPAYMITSNSSFGEEESGSKLSSSLMESKSHDSSLIDLKLGRLADGRDAQNINFSKERSVLSSIRPTSLAKRARTTASYSQTPCCQVHGCNMDLSSSKDYHKRHKVCEAHSKTARVIVNGMEQRFCQQCSRFHLLAEFDDGKRSCRKRLAGHNERRRKPQFHSLSSKPQKLLQSYQASADAKFLGSSLPKRTPFVFPGILPSRILYPEKYEQGSRCRQIKLEEKSVWSSPFTIPITDGQFLPKSFQHTCGNGKPYSPGIPPSATNDTTIFNMTSTVQELSGVSHPSRALSLLSAQSQGFSSHSAGIQVARPLINQSGRAHYNIGQILDKHLGVSSLENYAANGFYSSGINSMEVDQMESIMVSDAGHTVDFEVQADGYFQESEILNGKYCLSPEHETTVDLLQLSSHLQRVERQRNSLQVKQENEDLCCFLAT